jgi:hypothetical protein
LIAPLFVVEREWLAGDRRWQPAAAGSRPPGAIHAGADKGGGWGPKVHFWF